MLNNLLRSFRHVPVPSTYFPLLLWNALSVLSLASHSDDFLQPDLKSDRPTAYRCISGLHEYDGRVNAPLLNKSAPHKCGDVASLAIFFLNTESRIVDHYTGGAFTFGVCHRIAHVDHVVFFVVLFHYIASEFINKILISVYSDNLRNAMNLLELRNE